MSDVPEPGDWMEPHDRMERAIAEAMPTAGTWEEGCIAGALALGAPEDEASDGSFWSSWPWHDTSLFRFLTVHIAGSSWGLSVRELAGTAFLLSDVDEPRTEYAWDSWTPPTDRSALEAAVRTAWLEHWSDIGLPPAICGADAIWDGPPEGFALAFRCLDELVGSDDRAWSTFMDRFDDVVDGLMSLQAQGVDLATLGGSIPRPAHDVDWLARTTATGVIDACRTDDAARRSLVAYFLM